MPELNKNEFGQVLTANFGQDISANTALSFIMEPKQGEKIERTASDGVVVGAVNIEVNDESYLANEYVQYTIKEGDLDFAGQWRKKAEATLSATEKVISDYTFFEVLE